jgi:hypothetical protein
MSDENKSGSLGVIGHLRIGDGANAIRLENGPGNSLLIGSGSTAGASLPVSPNWGPPMSSGKWYTPSSTAGFGAGSAGFNSNRMIFVPVLFGKACTLNGIAIRVTIVGEAGSVCRLGLYTDADGLPSTLVADWGTVPGDAVAVPTLTPSTAVQTGWYWQAIAFQAAATTRPTLSIYQNSPASNRVGDASAGSTSGVNNYFKDGISGALPATASLDGTLGLASTPAIWMKAA